MKNKFNVLVKGIDFPEGPYFDKQNNLWCVELQGGNLIKYVNKKDQRYPTQGSPNGLVVDVNNKLLFCDAKQNSIRLFDSQNNVFDNLITSTQTEHLDKPNDLCFDRNHNLIFTCPGNWGEEKLGSIYCYNITEMKLRVLSQQLYFPNGLAIVDNGKSLVVAETKEYRLWKGKWNSDKCEWINPKPWINVGGPTGPDGMVLSKNNLLYVAVYGLGLVKVFDATGELVDSVKIPGKNPTNVTLDPMQTYGLVVTETEYGQLLSYPELDDVGIDYD